jgi:hypothetical protein
MTLDPMAVEILSLKKGNIVLTSHCPLSIWPSPKQVKSGGGGDIKYINCVFFY